MSDPAPRRRLRFSLRSLILFIVLISSGTGLWYRWESWVKDFQVDYEASLYFYSADGSHIAILVDHTVEWINAWSGARTDWLPPVRAGDIFAPMPPKPYQWSSDGVRAIGLGNQENEIIIVERRTQRQLWSVKVEGRIVTYIYNPSDHRIAFEAGEFIYGYHRRRRVHWWGVAWLPEFWLTLALGTGLVVSIWRDRKRLRSGTTQAA